jgi:long-chain fatty acid transport protein
MRFPIRRMMLFVFATLLPAMAGAQGHMLHGFGPVNSSMGGAGTALPNESLGALAFNPALLSAAEGNQISFTTEFFKDGLRIDLELGALKGRTEPTIAVGVIPAFGWQLRKPGGKLAIGFGLVGIAGFRTDYPQDTESIVFARWPQGFGRIYTDYNVTKIPVSMAYQVSPKVAIGASLNVYRGLLAIAPLPYKVFDVSATTGQRFYPLGGNLVPSWALAGQFGIYVKASDKVSLGASVTTPQNFQTYKWNSYIADPTSPVYGQHRTIDFDLDGPLMAGFGVGFKPNKKLSIALDGHFTKYSGVNGFGSPGGVVDRIVYPFGWRNIWTVKTGMQYQASEKLTLRLGYNHSQMPLRPEVVLTATGAPATFQKHFCGGFGLKMFPFLTAETGFYIVPREHVVGPFLDLNGELALSEMDTSNSIKSALIGLNFKF